MRIKGHLLFLFAPLIHMLYFTAGIQHHHQKQHHDSRQDIRKGPGGFFLCLKKEPQTRIQQVYPIEIYPQAEQGSHKIGDAIKKSQKSIQWQQHHQGRRQQKS